MLSVEYRVKPKTVWIITRYVSEGCAVNSYGSVETKGEYENADVAYEVAYALCKAEQDRERANRPDCPSIDETAFIFPTHPQQGHVVEASVSGRIA